MLERNRDQAPTVLRIRSGLCVRVGEIGWAKRVWGIVNSWKAMGERLARWRTLWRMLEVIMEDGHDRRCVFEAEACMRDRDTGRGVARV